MISTRSIKLLKAFEEAVYQAALTHQTNYAVERRALERHIARLEKRCGFGKPLDPHTKKFFGICRAHQAELAVKAKEINEL